MSEKR